jgi:hypothetical protein
MWEEGFTTTLMYYMDLNRWYWMMFWPKLRCSQYWNRCDWMISWPNMKCYVDWKISYRKVSRSISSTMWIRSVYRGRCHDLIWSIMWIRTDDTGRCLDLFWGELWLE